MAVDHSPDLFVLVLFFLCISYSNLWQTKLASSLVNFWAHNKIVSDWLIGGHMFYLSREIYTGQCCCTICTKIDCNCHTVTVTLLS